MTDQPAQYNVATATHDAGRASARPPITVYRRIGKRILFCVSPSIFILISVLAVLEFGFRLLTPVPAFAASLNLHMNLRTELEPDLHGVATPVTFTTNRWGMRGSQPPVGQEWENATTIVVVGGSTTQCFFLDDDRTWPQVMESELRARGHDVWVGNAGQAGHSTRGHVRMLEGAISRIKPDYVVFLVGVNDLCLSLRPKWEWDDSMSESILGRPRGVMVNWLLDHSRLAYHLNFLKQVHFDGTLIRTRDFSVPLPTEPITGEEFTLPDNLDDVLPSLPLFRDNIRRLVHSVRENGGIPIFLTQPLLIDQSPQWETVRATSFWMNKERFHLTGVSYARLLDRFNQVLKTVCAEHNAACFDLANRVPHSSDYYYDMVHYNDAGAKLIGQTVGAYLDEHALARPTSPS